MPHCNKKMISFFLTTKCNLCCRYCYCVLEREKIQEISLNLEVAKAGIDWYFSRSPYRHIRFYGPGEPTQEFSLMKQIVEYAREKTKPSESITVEIQSNGVFTEEVRQWLLDNATIVWLSFDGMREIQDYYRPINPRYQPLFKEKSSAEVLEDNVKWLITHAIQQKKKIMVGARATITEENVNRQCEMVDYFYNLGIRYIWTDPLFHEVSEAPVCDDERRSQKLLNLDNYVDAFVFAHKYAKTKGVFWGSFYMANFDGESEYNCRCCTPLEAPHITPDGYISACDMVTLGCRPHHMAPLVVGKWNRQTRSFDFIPERIAALINRKSSTMQHCFECPAKLYCGGYCVGETLNETGRIDGYVQDKCDAIVRMLQEIGVCDTFRYLHP